MLGEFLNCYTTPIHPPLSVVHYWDSHFQFVYLFLVSKPLLHQALSLSCCNSPSFFLPSIIGQKHCRELNHYPNCNQCQFHCQILVISTLWSCPTMPMKLTQCNYPSWQAWFYTLMFVYNLLDYLDDTQLCPEPTIV